MSTVVPWTLSFRPLSCPKYLFLRVVVIKLGLEDTGHAIHTIHTTSFSLPCLASGWKRRSVHCPRVFCFHRAIHFQLNAHSYVLFPAIQNKTCMPTHLGGGDQDFCITPTFGVTVVGWYCPVYNWLPVLMLETLPTFEGWESLSEVLSFNQVYLVCLRIVDVTLDNY